MFDPKRHCVVVVGAQWGDEGKGKIVDVLAERADLVVRYQGGANAGHTVIIGDDEFILHHELGEATKTASTLESASRRSRSS